MGAKRRGKQNAARFILKLHLAGIGVQKALYLTRLDACPYLPKAHPFVPTVFLRESHKAIVQPLGHDKRLAHFFPGIWPGNSGVPLAIHCIVVLTQQHSGHHLSCLITHFTPLLPTTTQNIITANRAKSKPFCLYGAIFTVVKLHLQHVAGRFFSEKKAARAGNACTGCRFHFRVCQSSYSSLSSSVSCVFSGQTAPNTLFSLSIKDAVFGACSSFCAIMPVPFRHIFSIYNIRRMYL